MNEILELSKVAPQPVLVGATVYLILTVRRIDARLDEVAGRVGCPARPRKRGKVVAALLAVAVAACLSGCTFSRTCTADGACTTNVTTSTNAEPVLREINKLLN